MKVIIGCSNTADQFEALFLKAELRGLAERQRRVNRRFTAGDVSGAQSRRRRRKR